MRRSIYSPTIDAPIVRTVERGVKAYQQDTSRTSAQPPRCAFNAKNIKRRDRPAARAICLTVTVQGFIWVESDSTFPAVGVVTVTT